MTSNEIDRREFARWAVGALGAAALVPKASAVVHKVAPGIKLCAQSSATPSDEQLLFLKQIGAEYVSVGSTPDLAEDIAFTSVTQTATW